jgi:DNA repair ATPase RecN
MSKLDLEARMTIKTLAAKGVSHCEIARMLGGVRITATTRQHADELLRQAREDAAAG